MTYEYRCIKCGHVFDVVKPVRDMDVNEFCPKCDEPSEKQFTARVHIMGAAVQHAEYNPALGCVTQNKEHRAEIAKRKGLTEVGNDFKSADSALNHFDKQREDTRKKRWESV